MNEVEKMYRNAGVDFGYNNFGVPNIQPPFTAEKQIELIKWLMNKSFSYSTVEDKDGVKYWFEIDYETSSHGFKNFEETIADTINEMWQSLTAEERKQIKEIAK